MAHDDLLLDDDTGDTGDTGLGVCLSPVACLCACHDSATAPAAFLALPLVGVALLRRRSQVVAQLAAADVLPEDVRLSLLEE
jgi:hypothetical protein